MASGAVLPGSHSDIRLIDKLKYHEENTDRYLYLLEYEHCA